MATFNGSRFLRAQLDSIICQLIDGDEIIVVDDCSTDGTVDLIRSYDDPRIKLTINEINRGHVQTFSASLGKAKNSYILLSDQDDFWVSGKIDLLVGELETSKNLLVVSNIGLIDEKSGSLKKTVSSFGSEDSTNLLYGYFSILAGSKPYFGCAMCFKRQLLKYVLPIPKLVEAHDIWIAMTAIFLRKFSFHTSETVLRRIHDSNISPRRRRGLGKVFVSRCKYVVLTFICLFRCMLPKN